MVVHIIWDNSNIWIGGKDACEKSEPAATLSAFRIHFENLYKLVLNGRTVGQSYLGGSVPPEAQELWRFARHLGCDVTLLRRVDSGKEQGVDEILHLKISNLLLDHDEPQTIAILSGNGATSEFASSFPGQVERALKRGWNVEIYSWEDSMNHRVYDPILQKHPNLMSYINLDDHYGSITFIHEGNYPYFLKDKKVDFFQGGRAVRPLTLPRPT